MILEDLELKCEVLARIAPHLPESAMVWTNTSSLSVHTMGVASGRPDRFVGTHGMNPVYQMPAVEVVRHPRLAEETLALTVEILEGLGKDPFVASDVSGFWVNKHLVPFMLEAMRALGAGRDHGRGRRPSASRAASATRRGCSSCPTSSAPTPCTGWRWRCTSQPRIPALYPPAILARMFKNGELGVKTGKGFYEWDGFKAVGGRDFSRASRITSSDTLLEV